VSPRIVDLPIPDDAVHDAGGDHTGKRGIRQLELLEFHGLRAADDLLEIGCGIGRLAYVLASFLEDDGSYTAFDISPDAIAWLNTNYAPRLPNFRFDLVELHHPRFRPKGKGKTAGFTFPYPDQQFDFACSFSVFQHLTIEQIGQYLREARRVLRPGGRALITLVAILPDDEDLTAASKPFQPVGNGIYESMPGKANTGYAYDDALLRATIEAQGLAVVDFVLGSWHHGRPAPDQPHVKPDTYVVTPA
jgi:SAM-dependent methyltransferase